VKESLPHIGYPLIALGWVAQGLTGRLIGGRVSRTAKALAFAALAGALEGALLFHLLFHPIVIEPEVERIRATGHGHMGPGIHTALAIPLTTAVGALAAVMGAWWRRRSSRRPGA
jgi:hypothetical protein